MGIFQCRCFGGGETSDYENIENYIGEKKLSKRHGKGVYYYGNGDMYDGEWKWGKKHGYGKYSYSNGITKIGYFFNDDYIGKEPGNLFAEEVIREYDPAKPLLQENHQTQRNPELSREVMEQRQKRMEELAERRESRRKLREEMRKKYNL